MQTTVRQLEPADAETYVALRAAMLEDAPLSFLASPETDVACDAESMRASFAQGPAKATFGAFVADELVGVVGVFPERHPKAAHKLGVWGMFVTPAARRHGIARQLLEAVIEHARSLDGVRQLALSVSATAPGAQRLYEQLGFRVWGVEPRALIHEGTRADEHHMVLLFED